MSPFGNGKCVKYDNGTEYTSVEFENILLGNKVKHPFSHTRTVPLTEDGELFLKPIDVFC